MFEHKNGMDMPQEVNSSRPEKEQLSKGERAKKALLAITAGIMLYAASPASAEQAGSKDEILKIENQIDELRRKRNELTEAKAGQEHKTFNKYLDYIDKSLKVGPSRSSSKGLGAKFGIYKNGEYIGDVVSETIDFPMEKFMEKVELLISKNKIIEVIEIIKIDQNANNILKNWGGYIKGNIINVGSGDITIHGDTKSVEITASGNDQITIKIINMDNTGEIIIIKDKKLVKQSKITL